MRTEKTNIDGVRLLFHDRHVDSRGWFNEMFHVEQFEKSGLPTVWKQSNTSFSFAGTLRGIHAQKKNPQGKLISCAFGSVFDVWVDLRKDSATFGKYEAAELNSKNPVSVFLPPGLGHGFFCQSKWAIVQYLCTETYDKETDGGVLWNDPTVGISWPFNKISGFSPVVSAKDKSLPSWGEYVEGLG